MRTLLSEFDFPRWTIVLLLLSACSIPDKDPKQVWHSRPITLHACSPDFRYAYTDKTSYFPGDLVTVFIQANKKVELCRLNIYDVNGNLALSIASRLFTQASMDTTEAGYDFNPTVKFLAPLTLVSGIYLIENQAPFIIKTRESVDVTVVYPVNTVNAYNLNGGKSLYSADNRPSRVSFLRPMTLQSQATYCLKWLPSLKDIKIGYISDPDLEENSSIEHSKIILLPGHSEYWTRQARLIFDNFIMSGRHAVILSANTMWWQVRYSDDQKDLICYKDVNLDPISDPLLKTITWDSDLLQYSIMSSIGADFSHGGYGLQIDYGWNGFKICTPGSPLLQGSGLNKGDILSFPSGEYDGSPLLGFDANGCPQVDEGALNFEKIELIGFDKGRRNGKETIGTFVVFQKSSSSGIVINAASYGWCAETGMGGTSGGTIKQITLNAINLLLKNESVFSK